MKRTSSIVFFALLALFLLGYMSVFVVDETENAIVLQLGKPVGDVRKPGLHFRIPFIQEYILFDVRVIESDTPPKNMVTLDKKTILVDSYTRWKIVDPLLFYRTVRNESQGRIRLDNIVQSGVQELISQYDLIDVVSKKRSVIMDKVTEKSNALTAAFGIKVLDVRIKRADLPEENQKKVFERMRAERARQSKQYRSEGMEESTKIRTATDKERQILIAEADRAAEVIRGEGDAEATRIYAQAMNRDPEFYGFLRSLEAYRKGFSNNTAVILGPDSEFLENFQ